MFSTWRTNSAKLWLISFKRPILFPLVFDSNIYPDDTAGYSSSANICGILFAVTQILVVKYDMVLWLSVAASDHSYPSGWDHSHISDCIYRNDWEWLSATSLDYSLGLSGYVNRSDQESLCCSCCLSILLLEVNALHRNVKHPISILSQDILCQQLSRMISYDGNM